MKFALTAALMASLTLILGSFLAADNAQDASNQLEKPILLEASGKPIDTDIGHAAPYLCDWDSDGDRDLLVGQFGDGKLRIYTNVGTDKKPRYEGPTWFEAGGEIGTIPSG
ncbi:MAG TPA: hypothetical protein EYN79_10170 [Planctomycetes bacterium]|nr:hypothetical protein [Planctomycetota bacterium]HIN80744.1 hypothetical protein [Planctomycetota bacterium]